MKLPKHYKMVNEHPNSYEIHDERVGKNFHIAKSGLDLGMHANLAKLPKLADGGPVKDDIPEPNKKNAREFQKGATESGIQPGTWIKNIKEGLGFADGGMIDPDDSSKKTIEQIINFPHPTNPPPKPKTKPKGYADGGDIPYDTLIPQEQARMASEQAPYGVPEQASPSPMPTSAAQVEGVRPVQPPAVSESKIPNSAQDILAAEASSANGPSQEELGTVQKAIAAQQAQSAKTAAAYADQNKLLKEMKTPQQIMQESQAAHEQLVDAINKNQIDPNRIWSSPNGLNKVSAGIGMILGGLGSGLSGGPNLAAQTIQNAIDRDIDAQKNDQAGRMNLLRVNEEATHNKIAANLETRNQLMASVMAQVQQYAAQAGGSESALKLAPLVQQLKVGMQANDFHKALLLAGDNGQTLSVDPSLLLSRIPPSQQAAAAKEIATASEVKKLHDNMEMSAKDLQSKFMNGLLSPSDRASAMGAFAGQIAKLSEGRFNMEESKLQADALLPGRFDSASTIANKAKRRQEFFSSMAASPVFKSATGIGLDKFQGTSIGQPISGDMDQTQAQQLYMRQNANSPNPEVQRRVQFLRSKFGVSG